VTHSPGKMPASAITECGVPRNMWRSCALVIARVRNYSLHKRLKVSRTIHRSVKRYNLQPGRSEELYRLMYWLAQEESRNDVAQVLDRGGAVDSRPQMRSIFEAFGVPRGERAHLIYHPAIVARGSRLVDPLLPIAATFRPRERRPARGSRDCAARHVRPARLRRPSACG